MSTIGKKERERDEFNVPARQGGLRNFFKGKRENLQFAQEEEFAFSLTPKSSQVKWAGCASPGQGAAGRCEVACLNALRTFSCSEKK